MKYLNKDGLVYFWGKIKEAIEAVKTKLTTHTNDTTVHVTSAEKAAWNAKADASEYLPLTGGTITGDLYLDSETYIEINYDGYLLSASLLSDELNGVAICDTNFSTSIIATDSGYVYVGDYGNNPIQIKNVATPTDDTDAVNKAYVDANSGGVTKTTTTASLTTTEWSTTTDGVYKTVAVSGVTSSNTVIVAPNKDTRSIWQKVNLCAGAQGTNTITFYADKAPTSTVTVNILILN